MRGCTHPDLCRVDLMVAGGNVDEVTEECFRRGADSVSRSPSPEGTLLSVLTTSPSHILDAPPAPVIETIVLKNDDWKNTWLRDFTGCEVTPEVYVTIPQQQAPSGYTHVIRINPADAFGEGNHPTTRMCARLLLDHAGEGTSPRGALLDAGTGTGILAILARRLGYEPVTALEIDAGAFRRARENLLHNDISDINLVCLDLRDHDGGPCDVIVANLLTAVLLENLSLLAQSLSEKGTLIVSGIGSQWKKEFLEALESSGLEPLVILEEENWIACRAGRKS